MSYHAGALRTPTQESYIAFWFDGERTQPFTTTIVYPPHESPRGSILNDFIIAAIKDAHPNAPEIVLHGVAALHGTDREIAMGDGRVATLVLQQNGWRVVV